jgi:hypothetical protein
MHDPAVLQNLCFKILQSYCKTNILWKCGYKIKHVDGLYNSFLPTFKWLYIFSPMIVDIYIETCSF